jgi:hypothetical protein
LGIADDATDALSGDSSIQSYLLDHEIRSESESLASWNANASRSTWTGGSFGDSRSISNDSWISRESDFQDMPKIRDKVDEADVELHTIPITSALVIDSAEPVELSNSDSLGEEIK